jgi:hypothetical protein
VSDAATPTKVCTGCNRELPLDAEHYHRRAVAGDGFNSRCKTCCNSSSLPGRAPDEIDPDESPAHLAMNEQLRRLRRLGLELAATVPDSQYFGHHEC